MEIRGGLDIATKLQAQLQNGVPCPQSAVAPTDCSEGMGLSHGLMVSARAPPFKIETGVENQCTSFLGPLQEHQAISTKSRSDDRLQCMTHDTDVCSDSFSLCKDAGRWIREIFKQIDGKHHRSNGDQHCGSATSSLIWYQPRAYWS